MKIKLLVIIIPMLFSVSTVFSQDVSNDVDSNEKIFKNTIKERKIKNIEVKGIKYSGKRFYLELPVKNGDIWTEGEKKKLIRFIEKLQNENIYEKEDVKIEEVFLDDNFVEIKIFLSESLPLFMFALPFYSTTQGFKAKIKYWNFFIEGFTLPLEGQLEYLAKENFNFYLKTNDPIVINEYTNIQFNIDCYTTTINYISTLPEWQNNNWENGIKDISINFNATIPDIDLKINPYFGFGYGNVITTKKENNISSIRDQNHIALLNPYLNLYYPIGENGTSISSSIGVGYKNFYSKIKDVSGDIISNKNEISLSLIGNNPKDIKDPLSNPINLFNFYLKMDRINSSFSTGLNFAFKNTTLSLTSGSDKVYSYDNIFLLEFDEDTFEETILKEIDDEGMKSFIKDNYIKDIENKKYVLKNNLSNDDKQNIWDILVASNFVYNNGLYVNPNIGFNFGIGDTSLRLIPHFNFSWSTKYEEIEKRKNNFGFNTGLGINYTIPLIDVELKIGSAFGYSRDWESDDIKKKRDFNIIHKFIISGIDISFEKEFGLPEFFLNQQKVSEELRNLAGHKVKINFNINADPVYENNYKTGSIDKTNNFKTTLEIMYHLYVPTYKDHKFKARFLVFTSFNNITEKSFGDSLIGSWVRGKGFNYLGGYAGLVINLDYWIPLFTVNTPRIIGKKIGKDLMWQVYWIWYTDIVLCLTNEQTDYTFDKNLLHILPAFTIGTAFRVYPKFVPLIINVEVNINAYNLLKERGSFTSFIYFEFSIARPVDTDWFSK